MRHQSIVKIINFICFVFFIFSLWMFNPLSALADNEPTFEVIQFDYQGGISELVKYLISWAFRLAGLLAFIMIIYAGFLYLTAGGNTEQQKQAQERIIDAIIGIVLLFSFWLILYTINPDILGEKKEISPPITPEEKEEIKEEEEIVKNLVQINGKLPLTSELDAYKVYLNKTLVNKLSGLTGDWVITDACIDAACSKTTVANRNPDDCHLDGTCVDIDAGTNAQNYDMISTFTNAGLYVLYEGNHLHVTLPNATGYGTFQGNYTISEGTWYLP